MGFLIAILKWIAFFEMTGKFKSYISKIEARFANKSLPGLETQLKMATNSRFVEYAKSRLLSGRTRECLIPRIIDTN